jgi:pimeloyl-ACP methyl ester carboxylesterase
LTAPGGRAAHQRTALADLVAALRKTYPLATFSLIGHSAGGGFALRIAACPLEDAFDRIGIDWPQSLPAIAFANVPEAKMFVTSQYSFRLLQNYTAPPDWRRSNGPGDGCRSSLAQPTS